MDHEHAPESLHDLTGRVRVLVQPDDGVTPVLELIAAAKRSVHIKQFTFSHPALLDATIAAHRAGCDVRVMLNAARSSGDRANDEAFATLQAAGVQVQWSNPNFAVTHEKSMVVDDRLALIATFNFCEKYFTQTRDYGLVVEDQAVIGEIRSCFLADWQHQVFRPTAPSPLLWSNLNSRQIMSDFIDSAHHSLDIQHPKLVDATIVERIAKARERGVVVRLLCGGRHGISDYDVLDTFASLRLLSYLAVKVHKQKTLRLHAKLVIVDGKRAQVGSMNIDRSAFDLRRELGVIVADPPAVSRLAQVFEADWQESRRYEAPDPLVAHAHVEADFPHDPDLMHD